MTSNDAVIHIRRSNNVYRDWLIGQILYGTQYRYMLQQMYEKEFVWHVPNDDNRIADGYDLRIIAAEQKPEITRNELVPYGTCLEVLVGLSHRLQFQTSHISARAWAFKLLENLQLTAYPGKLTHEQREEVDEILDRLIWRLYQSDGAGGFFPLAWPEEDQTKVEIWYQMAAYLNEQFRM